MAALCQPKFADRYCVTIDGKWKRLRDEAEPRIKDKDFHPQAELAVARSKLQIQPAASPGDVFVTTGVSARVIAGWGSY